MPSSRTPNRRSDADSNGPSGHKEVVKAALTDDGATIAEDDRGMAVKVIVAAFAAVVLALTSIGITGIWWTWSLGGLPRVVGVGFGVVLVVIGVTIGVAAYRQVRELASTGAVPQKPDLDDES